jgi:putative ABC transport system substrate-binding protein
MRRRAFVCGAAAVLAVPPDSRAQQAGKVYRIGFLGLSSSSDYAANLSAFRQGLRDRGYEEGKNISIEYRWAGNRYERLPALASELVRLYPDVLVTHAAAGIRAAQQATSTIPIVMGVSADPVQQGLVKSLARPGGNTTGVASQLIELSAKRLDLLRETVPNLKRVAVLANLASVGVPEIVKETEVAARKQGAGVRSFAAKNEPAELEAVSLRSSESGPTVSS